MYSEDTGISSRQEKYDQMMVKREKVVKTDGVKLPVGYVADIKDSYKYLGIP